MYNVKKVFILSGVQNLDRAVISFPGQKIGLKRIDKAWRENIC